MFCNKCGNKLTDDARFCVKCGYKVESINSTNKIFRKEYEFLGKDGRTKLTIEGNRIIISRPGMYSKFSHGFAGEKTILINNISSVQFKPVGFATSGYLQFIFPGSMEKKSGAIRGAIDENIIYFGSSGFDTKSVNNRALEIKRYIENYSSKENVNNNVTNIYNSSDKYDKLAKIKKLLDQGVLSQEEFDNEKKKILN